MSASLSSRNQRAQHQSHRFDAMTDPAIPVVQATALARLFGTRRAVDGVDFTLRAGEALALFGPNGAGKTTLLRLLAGLLRPSAGSATVAGDKLPGGASARAHVGVIGHSTMLYASLSALENVEFAARLQGIASPAAAAQAALDCMRLGERAMTPVRTMSRGMQQRVAIARATVHRPRLLLCDEPFIALDEPGAAALGELLTGLRAEGSAVVLVTHDVAHGLRHATHAGIMRDGRLLAIEPCAGLDPARYAARYREMSGVSDAA